MRKGTLAFLLIFFIVGLLLLVFQHEQAHVEINREWGIESHISFTKDFPNAVTIAEEPCPTNECGLAHNNNESFGYTFIGFYVSMGILLIALRMSMDDKE